MDGPDWIDAPRGIRNLGSLHRAMKGDDPGPPRTLGFSYGLEVKISPHTAASPPPLSLLKDTACNGRLLLFDSESSSEWGACILLLSSIIGRA
ncbi:hypothetical protein NL676_010647 [Syzygium grande]|nr:hypothetical protein NL676_010647 [Syzygium grande]